MCGNVLILWDAKVAECCVPKKENEAGRTARMLIHICSQTHTLTALKGIHKNYAADNVFIQIYHSICQLHNMFIKLGTRAVTACSFWCATVVISTSLAASLAVVFQIIASGILVTSLPHQNKKFKFKYIKGTTSGTNVGENKIAFRKRIQ